MNATRLLAELETQGVTLSTDGIGLKVRAPSDLPSSMLETIKQYKGDLVAHLQRGNTVVPKLPQPLIPLIRAAASDLLPGGAFMLKSGGMVPNLNRFVLAWSAIYLTGDHEHALEMLWQARKVWQADKVP